MSHLNSHQHHNQLPSPAPSPYPHGTGEADPDAVRAELEAQLLRLSQDLYEMEVCAGEVGAGMESAVPSYLAKINAAFINLSHLAPQVTDSVPRNVVDHVDRYKNPHQYTKTTLSRATGENQYALGRQLGLESFRRQLHDAISESFPGVPLPERRHQPVGAETNEEGEGETATAVETGASASGVGAGGVGGGVGGGVCVGDSGGLAGQAGASGPSAAGAGVEPSVREPGPSTAAAEPGSAHLGVVPSGAEASLGAEAAEDVPEPSTGAEGAAVETSTAPVPAAAAPSAAHTTTVTSPGTRGGAESGEISMEDGTEGAASTANGIQSQSQVNGQGNTEQHM